MNISETITALRRNRGFTQEDVARSLDVSIAAVSKWECGNSYPDITLLPKIAALFDVSVDYLLDYHRAAQKTVEEHIAHAYEFVMNRHNREADEYMTGVLARYPENNLVKIESARIKRIRTCGRNDTPLAEKMLAQAEELLKSVNLSELNRRETDMYYSTLAEVYRIMKRFDEAEEALDKIMTAEKINPEQSKYYLDLERGNVSGAIAGNQKLLYRAVHDIVVTSTWYYAAYIDEPEKVITQYNFLIRLLEAVTDGEASPFDRDLCYSCECISYMYAKLGERDSSVEYFRRAMEYAVRFDSAEVMTYRNLTPFFMLDESGFDFYPHGSGSLAHQTANIVRECGEERREYSLLRDDERVKKILADYT